MSKTFSELFESVSQAVAMKTLGLSSRFTEEDLKAAYRKAAKENHPDRGGSTEKMQNINTAYEALKGKSGADQEMSFQDRQAKSKEEKQVILNFVTHMFDKFFDTQAYLAYFEKMAGKKFRFERHIKSPSIGNFVAVDYKFTSEDNTVFFDMTAMATIFITKALGAGFDKPELSDMGVTTEVMIDRKKVKMTQTNYNRSETEKFMKDPKVLFPETKLKKAFASDKKVKPLKKADYVLFVKKELGGRNLGGDDYAIDLGNGSVLYFSRMTWMRKGLWNVSGRTADKNRWSVTASIYEIETHENMDVMANLVKDLKTHNSESVDQIETRVKKNLLNVKTF